MKKVVALLVVLSLIFTLTGCLGGTDNEDSGGNSPATAYITLEGSSITLEGDGATVNGSVVTITSAGSYSISGTLDDGQIIVNTEDEAEVKLILNGVDISCSTSAPIYILNAEETEISLADGTENYLTDGDSYILEDEESDEPGAAIFSNDDLTIGGNGSLTVVANYNNGIQSKDDLEIAGGNITVDAVNDGIKGRDSITIEDANITINAGGDGMQANNDEDSTEGYITVESGTITITAGADGIQAETSLIISGGEITISSGGGSINGSHTEGGDAWGDWGNPGNPPMTNDLEATDAIGSAKGLKAGVELTITGGTINIDSADDAIHSNDSLKINGGNISLASGDDGLHSDLSLEINGGDITVSQCYEGLESNIVTINDGDIHILSSDDGINAIGSGDGTQLEGQPAQGDFNASGDSHLYINGGYLFIDAGGDGLDINGPIAMTGGVVIINGPTTDANGALDYLGSFNISGGFLVAVGSSGMALAPSTSSAQYSVMVNFSSAQSAGTMLHIETEDGREILTFLPTKAYQSVVFCSPELENGSTYLVYVGGSSTGTTTDGLYSGGTYSAGSQYASLTISSMVTTIGSSGGFPGGGFPDGRRR